MGTIIQPSKEGDSDTFRTQVNLTDIMRHELSWTQKDNYCMVPLREGSRSNQIQRDRKTGGSQEMGGRRQRRGAV